MIGSTIELTLHFSVFRETKGQGGPLVLEDLLDLVSLGQRLVEHH